MTNAASAMQMSVPIVSVASSTNNPHSSASAMRMAFTRALCP